jgi:glycosyltransferase involved in cell wall biosynthesis
MAEPSVLICIPTLGSGGAERQVKLLAPRLVARGLRLALFSRIGEADQRALAAQGVRCFPVKARGNHDPRRIVELRRAAAAARADIVHTFLPQMDIVGGAVALLTRRKWLLSERSSPLAYGGGGKDRLRARLGRRANVIVANSEAGLQVWPDHRDRRLIANGLDHDALAAAPALSGSDDAALAGRFVLASVARLSPEKRHDLLVAATARLKPAIPGLLTLFFGEGPGEAALRAQAVALGVEDDVRFMGYRGDVWSWLKRASLFVSMSVFEGHPNAVIEAAAARVPLILSDIAAHRAAVGDDGARFVPVGGEAALVEAVAALARGAGAARAASEAALRWVAPLSIDRSADLYADLYRELAASAS